MEEEVEKRCWPAFQRKKNVMEHRFPEPQGEGFDGDISNLPVVECSKISHSLHIVWLSLAYLLSGSWPPKKCQIWVPFHRMDLISNQILVGPSHKFCATIVLAYLAEKLPWPWHLFIAIETITKTTIGTRDWDIAVIGDHVFDWRKMNFGKAVETLCLGALVKMSSTILSRYGESGQPFLPYFNGISINLSPFKLMLAQIAAVTCFHYGEVMYTTGGDVHFLRCSRKTDHALKSDCIYYENNEVADNAATDHFEVHCQRMFIVTRRTITGSTDNTECHQSEAVETELELDKE
ncbi:hypothetical protein STEG23_021201 [Scotinomys teguina]